MKHRNRCVKIRKSAAAMLCGLLFFVTGITTGYAEGIGAQGSYRPAAEAAHLTHTAHTEAVSQAAQSGQETEEDGPGLTQEENAEDAASAALILPDGRKVVSLGSYKLTGYCPCRQCSEGYGNMTATGGRAAAGRTVAVDPRVIPYGSRLLINGHEYIAEDCGGAVKNRHIDIYFSTHAEAGNVLSYAEVYLIQ